jgi:drug/metabolite transporter (DMT)-like permease
MLKVHLGSLLFAIIFGFTFMFSKVVLETVSPLGLMAYRFLWAIIAIEILRRLKIIKVRFEKQFLPAIVLVIIFQPILYFLFEIYGLNLISSAEAGMMIALIPVFVAILSSVILKEPPSRAQVLFIFLSVSGIIVIQLADLTRTSSEFLGFFLMLLAVLSASLFNIASRSASKKLNPAEITYFMMLTGAILFNLLYVGELFILQSLDTYFLVLLQPEVIFPLLYLGIVASIGGFFLVNFALKNLPAHISSMYANLATVVSIAAGAIILSESITGFHLVGSLMIMGGVYGTVRAQQKKPKPRRLYERTDGV